jgi:quercetin dioxygenase-like cupin family protein
VGFVASDNETLPLRVGDVAFIEKNTPHWHGACPGQDFTHLSILTPGQMQILEVTDSSDTEGTSV